MQEVAAVVPVTDDIAGDLAILATRTEYRIDKPQGFVFDGRRGHLIGRWPLRHRLANWLRNLRR